MTQWLLGLRNRPVVYFVIVRPVFFNHRLDSYESIFQLGDAFVAEL